MKNQELADHLMSLGFVHGNVDKDLGTKVSGLIYLTRHFGKQFQYVSLCSYEGEFVEAVVCFYSKQFNGRDKEKQAPTFCTLLRSVDELLKSVETP